MKESYKILILYGILLIALIIAIFGLYQWVVWDHDKLYEAAQKVPQKSVGAELEQMYVLSPGHYWWLEKPQRNDA